MAPSMQHATRVGVGATSGSAATLELEFLSCGIGLQESHVQSDGIRGTRSRIRESVVKGVQAVGGDLVIEPRPGDLDFFLPQMMGAGSNPTFTLAETLTDFGVDVYKVGQTCRYAGCKVNRASFSSSPNSPLRLAMDIQGKTETPGITFPSIAASKSLLQPYIHHQNVLTLGGTAYPNATVEVTIDNALVLDRFLNSQSRTDLPESDRIVTLSVVVPFTSTEASALYSIAVAGLAGTVVWTNGNYSLTMTFVKLQAPQGPVQIVGRNQELMLGIQFIARKDETSSALELVVANDSTG